MTQNILRKENETVYVGVVEMKRNNINYYLFYSHIPDFRTEYPRAPELRLMWPIPNMAKIMVPLGSCLPTLKRPIQTQTFYCALLLTNPPPLNHALIKALTFKLRIESHWAYIIVGAHFLLSHFSLRPT